MKHRSHITSKLHWSLNADISIYCYTLTRILKIDKSLTTKTSKTDKRTPDDVTYYEPFSIIFDKINIRILQELLKNHNIKSSEISLRLKVPLSTIQRRRTRIEKSEFLQHKYEIDPKKICTEKC